jgi:hypothetical protein
MVAYTLTIAVKEPLRDRTRLNPQISGVVGILDDMKWFAGWLAV